MGLSVGSKQVFDWLANLTAIAGLISWLAIKLVSRRVVSHRFRFFYMLTILFPLFHGFPHPASPSSDSLRECELRAFRETSSPTPLPSRTTVPGTLAS